MSYDLAQLLSKKNILRSLKKNIFNKAQDKLNYSTTYNHCNPLKNYNGIFQGSEN